VKRELPQGWKWVALGDLCEVKRGKSITKKGTTPGGIPVIAGGQQPAYYHNQANRVGEVITVSGSGAYAGFVNFFDQPIFASDCSTLQVKGKNARMVYIYLAMKWRQQDIYDLKLGSAQPHVYPKDVSKIEIPLPPVSEQERIVGILESEMMAVEKARGAALDRVEAARALGAAFLREVFEFGDKGLPQGWGWVELGDAATFIRGVTFKRLDANLTEHEGYLPILRAGNIGEQLDTENNLVWVPGSLVAEQQLLRNGDIAICMSSGSPSVVGKTALLQKNWVGSVGAFCGIVRAKNTETSKYLFFWFRSPPYLKWRDSQARGANIQNLKFSEFKTIKIPFPSHSEQRRIVSVLSTKMTAAKRASAAAEAELEAIEALPGALLRRAFGGEL